MFSCFSFVWFCSSRLSSEFSSELSSGFSPGLSFATLCKKTGFRVSYSWINFWFFFKWRSGRGRWPNSKWWVQSRIDAALRVGWGFGSWRRWRSRSAARAVQDGHSCRWARSVEPNTRRRHLSQGSAFHRQYTGREISEKSCARSWFSEKD